MDSVLKQVAQVALRNLQRAAAADQFTCHFFNPFAHNYWIFDASYESLKYPYQVFGPLTHPDQTHRFQDSAIPEPITPQAEVWFYSEIPELLSTNVLAGVSFARRESVKKSIRIRIAEPDLDSNNSEVDLCSEVHVFLNYLDVQTPFNQDALLDILRTNLPHVTQPLLKLAQQPRLDEYTAWKLRSHNQQFRKELERTLVPPGPKFDVARDHFYELILSGLRRLLSPLRNKATTSFCSLSLVDRNNAVTACATNPSGILGQPGIVEHVARTGQMFLINDVPGYIDRVNREGVSESLPKYSTIVEATKSELACPLVVQGRVVGVLNIEADAINAFDDAHALLLFQIANSAALAIRDIHLWKDFDSLLAYQQNLLEASSLEGVFEEMLKAIAELGYEAPRFWDLELNEWRPRAENRSAQEPRPDGYTELIVETGLPVMLADIQLLPGEASDFTVKEGRLDTESRYFIGWRNIPTPRPLGENLMRLACEMGSVFTDLGFPIFDSQRQRVRGVLWTKCRRYSRAVLDDECWCISVLCRQAGTALYALARRQAAPLPEKLRETMLSFHFGEDRATRLMEASNLEQMLVASAAHKNVIVLNVDIRGSTRFGEALSAASAPEQYVGFMCEYQRTVHKMILSHGGVFDKTMGDGIMALWNIFRPDLLRCPPYDQVSNCQIAAVSCVLEILKLFKAMVRKYAGKLEALPPDDFCLGVGLDQGEAYVGGMLSPQDALGFEFSAHGKVANSAGKLVGLARGNEMVSRLREVQTHSGLTVWNQPDEGFRGPSEVERERLLGVVPLLGSIVLCSTRFEFALKGFCSEIWRIPMGESAVVMLPVWREDLFALVSGSFGQSPT